MTRRTWSADGKYLIYGTPQQQGSNLWAVSCKPMVSTFEQADSGHERGTFVRGFPAVARWKTVFHHWQQAAQRTGSLRHKNASIPTVLWGSVSDKTRHFLPKGSESNTLRTPITVYGAAGATALTG
jgi:hypothetical protein